MGQNATLFPCRARDVLKRACTSLVTYDVAQSEISMVAPTGLSVRERLYIHATTAQVYLHVRSRLRLIADDLQEHACFRRRIDSFF